MGLDESYLGLAASMGVQVVDDGEAEDAVAVEAGVDEATPNPGDEAAAA